MKKIFLTIALVAGMMVSAQVKIGDQVTTLNPNSLLELQSTNKGVLFPRVALTGTTSFAPLSAHVPGMTVYNTATTSDVKPGLYSNDGTQWLRLVADSATALNVTAEQTGSYTALATDDIILVNYNTGGLTVTLPTSGVSIGKKYYIINAGSSDCGFTNSLRSTNSTAIGAGTGAILMYLGGTGSGSWAIITAY